MVNLKLSVIIPCYNGGRFVESAILSVLQQPVNNIEILVIDDGSVDDTPDVLRKYCNQIRCIRTENRGAGHARNVGIKNAIGEWIAFLDADDLYLSNSINDLLMQLLHSTEADVIYTPFMRISMDLKGPYSFTPAEEPNQIVHMPRNAYPTCIYRKSFLENNNLRFFEYKEQDIETAFRYLVFSKKPKVITRNDIRYYLQRVNPYSNTNTWKAQIMHSTKALVYYELFRNHSLPESKKWLFETAVEQLYLYFSWVRKEGIVSRKAHRQSQKLLLRCLFQNPLFWLKTNVRRIYLKNLVLGVWTFFTLRKCNIIYNKPSSQYYENSQEIIERLSVISDSIRLEE